MHIPRSSCSMRANNDSSSELSAILGEKTIKSTKVESSITVKPKVRRSYHRMKRKRFTKRIRQIRSTKIAVQKLTPLSLLYSNEELMSLYNASYYVSFKSKSISE